jgi:hypothetical protein
MLGAEMRPSGRSSYVTRTIASEWSPTTGSDGTVAVGQTQKAVANGSPYPGTGAASAGPASSAGAVVTAIKATKRLIDAGTVVHPADASLGRFVTPSAAPPSLGTKPPSRAERRAQGFGARTTKATQWPWLRKPNCAHPPSLH